VPIYILNAFMLIRAIFNVFNFFATFLPITQAFLKKLLTYCTCLIFVLIYHIINKNCMAVLAF